MCGVAGVLLSDGAVPAKQLAGLARALGHRGPNSEGFLSWDGHSAPRASVHADEFVGRVGFVHRRLPIIDLSAAGWQPMVSTDGTTAIVYNGEMYNFLELRDELTALGHEFTSHCDTEVFLCGWKEWGEGLLSRVVGMFAVAILDVRSRHVFLARDFAGIKPLYLARWNGGLAFSSEIQSLLELPQVSSTADPQSVLDYLAHEIVDHGERTFFRDVSAVPPATVLVLDADTGKVLRRSRFWSAPTHQRRDISYVEAVATTRQMFLDSVALHLRSDVPVGVALSGGIDSSSIAAAVREIGGSDVDLRTFSYIPSGHALSEERWIEEVVRATNARSTYVHPTGADLARNTEVIVKVQGEPVGGPSVLAQYHVFRAAREDGVIVMLDGQGADEMLAGYKPMAVAHLAALLRRGRVQAAWRLALGATQDPHSARTLFVRGLRRVAAAAVPTRATRSSLPAWLDLPALESLGAVDESAAWRGHQTLSSELTDFFTRRSLPHLLRYEDRNSMAWSLESRVPFLTPALANWFLSLPPEFVLAADGTSKAVFRDAMRGIVPDAVLNRRDKLGFEVPAAEWLTENPAWVRQVVSDGSDCARGIVVPEALRAYDAAVTGTRAFDPAVWRWLNLVLWCQAFDVRW